jgi:hypothetical protein
VVEGGIGGMVVEVGRRPRSVEPCSRIVSRVAAGELKNSDLALPDGSIPKQRGVGIIIMMVMMMGKMKMREGCKS